MFCRFHDHASGTRTIRHARTASALLVGCASTILLSGCGGLFGAGNSAAQAARGKFLLPSAPAGAITFAAARKQIAGETPIILTGRIGVPDQQPWVEGKAMFVIRDASGENHGGADHDPANCPFCKRRAAQPESMAVIEFLDEQGKPLAIGARELFELTENQLVTVQGRARLDPSETLVLSADGIFVGK